MDGILRSLREDIEPSSVTAEIDGQRWSYVNTVEVEWHEGRLRFALRDSAELFLLDEDPEQTRNRALRNPRLVRRLGRQLLEWYAANEVLATKLATVEPEAVVLSEEEKALLQGLGYIQEPSDPTP